MWKHVITCPLLNLFAFNQIIVRMEKNRASLSNASEFIQPHLYETNTTEDHKEFIGIWMSGYWKESATYIHYLASSSPFWKQKRHFHTQLFTFTRPDELFSCFNNQTPNICLSHHCALLPDKRCPINIKRYQTAPLRSTFINTVYIVYVLWSSGP